MPMAVYGNFQPLNYARANPWHQPGDSAATECADPHPGRLPVHAGFPVIYPFLHSDPVLFVFPVGWYQL